jgi:hypothetical protein
MGEMRNAFRFLVGNLEGKTTWDTKPVAGRIILKLTLKLWDDGV